MSENNKPRRRMRERHLKFVFIGRVIYLLELNERIFLRNESPGQRTEISPGKIRLRLASCLNSKGSRGEEWLVLVSRIEGKVVGLPLEQWRNHTDPSRTFAPWGTFDHNPWEEIDVRSIIRSAQSGI